MEDWEALADSSEALDKVISSNPNLQKHADEDKVPEPVPAPAVVSKPKQPRKVIGEEFDKKQKAKAKPADPLPADPIASKLDRQRMVEEADHELTDELFEDVPKVTLGAEETYRQYAALVVRQLGTGLPHRIPVFLREVLRAVAPQLTSAHLIDVHQTLTALISEKQKQEKGPEKKKKTNTKATLKGVGKSGLAQDYGSEEDFDDEDDEYADYR